MSLDSLFGQLWTDYCQLSPHAARIHALLVGRGEKIINDHIALRTFSGPTTGLAQVARPFEALGYQPMQEYTFKEKKLFARHWEHPNEEMPKVFISELETAKFPERTQQLIAHLVEQIDGAVVTSPTFFISGRPWTLDRATYQELAQVSEYASWLAAYGFRPNHFTVSVNHLKTFAELADLNGYLKGQGYKLNASGGEIKGTPAECLEQSSTLAEEIEVSFSDGKLMVPSVYYEFAKRHHLPNGKLYTGFIAQSADKIFESTDRQATKS